MSIQPRRIEPEWLDALAPGDPRARQSRRDLDRVNAVMGNARIVAAQLQERFFASAPIAVADIGAGDGSFMWRVARLLPQGWNGTRAVLVDRLEAASQRAIEGLDERGWKTQCVPDDLLHWLAQSNERYDAMLANLVLHHFDSATLEQLLNLIAKRTDVFIACEPRRSGLARAGSRLLGLIGCNEVSRHDALVSVNAGFIGAELAGLWPRHGGWTLEECERGLFTHCFTAWRPGSRYALVSARLR